jgi:chaperonin cofactor prefoldin
MEKEFNKIKTVIDQLSDLQLNHIESFDQQGVLPDLETQSSERETGFDNLKKKINAFNKMAQNNNSTQAQPMLVFINNRITTLLDQNKILEAKVKQYKDNIKSAMKKISKGKHVIGSYGSSANIAGNPRVISITN